MARKDGGNQSQERRIGFPFFPTQIPATGSRVNMRYQYSYRLNKTNHPTKIVKTATAMIQKPPEYSPRRYISTPCHWLADHFLRTVHTSVFLQVDHQANLVS